MKTFAVIVTSFLVLLLAIILGFRALNTYITPPVATNQWWGPSDEAPATPPLIDDIHIEELPAIQFEDEKLEDLKKRLSNARYFRALENTNWSYGSNTQELKEFVRYWLNEFKWREQEKRINQFKHYTATIDGIEIHYIHVKPQMQTRKVIPIMLIHGWPGSFYEFYKAIPLLTGRSKDDFSFEVICPSLPGYIFSEAPHKSGLGPLQIANLFRKLMARLGHGKYYVQGGDWGSGIARAMALIDTSHIKGIHLNMFVTGPPYGPFSLISAYFFPSWSLGSEKHKIIPLKDFFGKLLWESGYFHVQATKPESVGVALNDSPLGLANYILEKFFTWSGCKGHQNFSCLESKFTKDELITNIMLYWLTESMPSAMRLYRENKIDRSLACPISLPTAMANFPHEIFQIPQAWLHVAFPNIVQFTEMPRGGHFAAFQEPELFADDVWKFVQKVENIVKEEL
ncbi:epoxide hydrolase 1-like [Dendronephthya gigantea]|uniref:epoxide hydrolase 1-like n=1 Tax=Dendronephthya gigantea TaxID=151771 RepID=UPI00106B7D60|nr:epoxide hydrolase 1-like [Dendronephthya gigantea]